jgi:hypothetical protein
METMARRLLVAVGFGILLASAVARGEQDYPRAMADTMASKVTAIATRGSLPPIAGTQPAPVRTSFTEAEANAYFEHYGPALLPAGVVDPRVSIADGNRVAARAVVDLDAVRKARERGWLDPLGYVTGSLEVKATGKLFAANGVGLFQFESGSVGGVAVSKALLQELISFYTATPEDPDGYQLGEPSPLPASIRAVEIKAGSATVVQ